MTPYYQDKQVTLYHGDCREVLPALAVRPIDIMNCPTCGGSASVPCPNGGTACPTCFDAPLGQGSARIVIVTDPPWPGDPGRASAVVAGLVVGCDRAQDLLAEALSAAEQLKPTRVVVVLGQRFDPRMLAAVPQRLSYATTLWLRYARKVPRAGALWEADVGYVFGSYPTKGASFTTPQVGYVPPSDSEVLAWGNGHNGRIGRCHEHPCARHPDHARWLIGTWTRQDETVIDPFAGSGAFLRAAKEAGRRVIGIEVEERYCELIVREVAQDTLAL